MYPYPLGHDQNQQPVPFAEVLARSHQFYTIAQIETADRRTLAWGIAATGGSVTVDRGASFRRSLSMSVKGYAGSVFINADSGLTSEQLAEIKDSLIPDSPGDILSPYGNHIRLWYYIPVPGYFNSLFQNNWYGWGLGVFRISNADISDDAVPTLTISGYDQSRTISRNKLTQPWIVSAGQNYGDAIVALATDRLPLIQVRSYSVAALTPSIVVDPEQDPWQVITEWAAAFGHEVFFDADGYLVIQPEPDPAFRQVDWTYGDGATTNNALMLNVDRSMSDEPGYNGVILTAESSTLVTPLRSEVWDMNPSSPTYSLGNYGRVPKFVSNPYAATQEQADAAASAELLRSIGGTEKIDMSVVPNPAHEAGDVVRVVRPLSRTDQTSSIESFEFPLDANAMRISCRERRSLT